MSTVLCLLLSFCVLFSSRSQPLDPALKKPFSVPFHGATVQQPPHVDPPQFNRPLQSLLSRVSQFLLAARILPSSQVDKLCLKKQTLFLLCEFFVFFPPVFPSQGCPLKCGMPPSLPFLGALSMTFRPFSFPLSPAQLGL